MKNKWGKILFGGDYNPEQWPREIWKEDMRLFKLAGIDIATVNVFSWALNQPDEETFQFQWLDDVMDMLHENGIHACLATSTAAHPAWMASKYPDVLTVDTKGQKRMFGRRHNSCPNSPAYQKFSTKMASVLAERYKDHPAVLLWHVNNEYGWRCYCENCACEFREWLKERYGSLEALNRAWYTSFWGHTFYDWNEIVLPSSLSEHLDANHDKTAFQGISLDYDRFNSDSILKCYKLERDAIKAVIPDAMVTTNFQGNGTYKPLDYFKWAKELDVVALDTYPTNDMPMSRIAMRHDLMRGLKDGAPYMLMEQSPSQINWKDINPLKRPGVMRLWSYQAIARGAESVMFFQMRRSVGAYEQFHGAVIDHCGHENTRVFQECTELGQELQRLGDTLLNAKTSAKVAILFDWENWWSIEHSSGPSARLRYVEQIEKYYDALYDHNIQVDMIGTDTNLEEYEVVIAPVLYMLKPNYANKLEEFVERGGTLVTTFLSGIVDEHNLVTLGGYPGHLRKLLGIWIEEIDALFPDQSNSMVMVGQHSDLGIEGTFQCGHLCDLLHTEGADIEAVYGREFYAGKPVLTRNKFGKGEAWYIASDPEASFLSMFLKRITERKKINAILETPAGVEVTVREKEGQRYMFVLNHNDKPVSVHIGEEAQLDLLGARRIHGNTEIPEHGVLILQTTQSITSGIGERQ
ncbi:beta-galactosidase [Paenibacillus sp. FSL R10-2734]|uniref:beta-galactosidase n=1 Tax=Paenibacillus sp. FSL R10-2734 TaxID=2954691 RepID=UPI0030D6E804